MSHRAGCDIRVSLPRIPKSATGYNVHYGCPGTFYIPHLMTPEPSASCLYFHLTFHAMLQLTLKHA